MIIFILTLREAHCVHFHYSCGLHFVVSLNLNPEKGQIHLLYIILP